MKNPSKIGILRRRRKKLNRRNLLKRIENKLQNSKSLFSKRQNPKGSTVLLERNGVKYKTINRKHLARKNQRGGYLNILRISFQRNRKEAIIKII